MKRTQTLRKYFVAIDEPLVTGGHFEGCALLSFDVIHIALT
jgi:hypothetical protein